jgi:15-cis-phytoene synthase
MNATEAYAFCARVTRERATNFYYGIRLLPPDKRRALCSVYAFARRVDDIGDGSLPQAEKMRRLEVARVSLDYLTEGSSDPVLAALAHTCSGFPIPLEAFWALIDGVEMDVRGADYPRFGDLLLYCRRVAGTIGRLSLAVFGSQDLHRALPHADDLGVAMQLTNILRDVREDRALGRVYVPAEDLERFGCDPRLREARSGALSAVIKFEAARARSWFDRGLQLLPLLDSRSASCVRVMTDLYLRVLGRVERDPEAALAARVSLPWWEKVLVTAASLATGAGKPRPAGGLAAAVEVSG